MNGNGSYNSKCDSTFGREIRALTTEFGKDLKVAYEQPTVGKHITKCITRIEHATKILVPSYLRKAGINVDDGVWELDLTEKKPWKHGSIVLVAHATTEKRRLVIMSTNGTAKNIPHQFKVDMIALSPTCDKNNISVVRLKPLNLISTRKTWWIMHRPTLDLGLTAVYDEEKEIFNIRSEDEPKLRELYDRYVSGMEKAPKKNTIVQLAKHECMEQFMLDIYPTPDWKRACIESRSKPKRSSRERKLVKQIRYYDDDDDDSDSEPKTKRACTAIEHLEEYEEKINPKQVVDRDSISNIKIIRVDTEGRRLDPTVVHDPSFLQCIDGYEHTKDTDWNSADSLMNDIGQSVKVTV